MAVLSQETAFAVAEPVDSAKRRQIIDGARQVFLAQGFDGASMGEIARTAGVSKGTLYVYFASKEDLFQVVARSHDGRKILARRSAGRYQLLDVNSARPAGEPFALDEAIARAALGPDGRILVVESGAPPGGATSRSWSRIHDAATGKPLGQKMPGETIAFSPDGELVVVGPAAWRVPVTDVDDRRLPSGRPVRLVAFEPGGRVVVTVAGPAEKRGSWYGVDFGPRVTISRTWTPSAILLARSVS